MLQQGSGEHWWNHRSTKTFHLCCDMDWGRSIHAPAKGLSTKTSPPRHRTHRLLQVHFSGKNILVFDQAVWLNPELAVFTWKHLPIRQGCMFKIYIAPTSFWNCFWSLVFRSTWTALPPQLRCKQQICQHHSSSSSGPPFWPNWFCHVFTSALRLENIPVS